MRKKSQEPVSDEPAELRARLAESDKTLRDLRAANRRLERRIAEITAAAAERAEELLRSERQIEEQREILRSILDSSGEGIAVADLQGRIVAFNPAAREILQLEPAAVSQAEWSKAYGLYLPDGTTPFPPDDLPLARAIRGDSLDEAEIFVRHDGLPQGRRIRVTARPLRSTSGDIRGGVAVFRDVTQHRRLEEELRQGQKMEALGRFAGGIAHDFNNMLMGITGACTIVQRLIAEDHEARVYIAEIGNAVQHGVALSRQLLDFSRKRSVEKRTLCLNQVIAHVQTIVRRLLGESIELVIRSATAEAPVEADRGQLQQVLMNLLVNARDAISGNGTIAIDVREEEFGAADAHRPTSLAPGRYLLLEVADNGCGMSQEVLERAFDPFFTTKAPGRGTGLGLSTVYGVVRGLGGHVAIDSTPGSGTTVRVRLPRSNRAIEPVLARAGDAPRGRNEAILLVEDDDLVRRTVHENLRDLGYRVLGAARPSEALNALDKSPELFDLLLTDVLMPEMNGCELARLIRLARPGIGVLYMSAWPRDVLREQAQLDDASTLLRKPFPNETLAESVRAALHARA
jgi:signal transduction histidine kinase